MTATFPFQARNSSCVCFLVNRQGLYLASRSQRVASRRSRYQEGYAAHLVLPAQWWVDSR
jgi:hypothetical protein